MAKYKDWRKFDPLTMRNEQIRNTPEQARGGYSALAPVETVSATVPKRAAANPYDEDFNAGATYGVYGVTPDWAKRTPTEQARVNAAQARAQAEATAQGYAALAPATAPVPTTGTAPSFANLDDASKARMKQNNPALYNQLLVQGIISPLAEDRKQTATAPATEKKTESVPKTGAGSPSTVETELTEYAKYLADHPEFADSDRRAEAEYARALPTYGALAERMAQAGIHGGYSDYLQGVAYAKMQDAKQQNEEAARAGYAALGKEAQDANHKLYNLLAEESYTDADGNTVQGYNLLGLTDEQYNAVKPTLMAHLSESGYSPAQIESAFAGVERVRNTKRTQTETDIASTVNDIVSGVDGAEDEFLKQFGYEAPARSEDESDEDYAKRVENDRSAAYLDALDRAVEQKVMTAEQRATALVAGLPINNAEYDNYAKSDWKSRAKDLADSVVSAKVYLDNKKITQADYDKIVEKVKEKLDEADVLVEEQHLTGWDNIYIQIGKNEIIHADRVQSVSPAKEEQLTAKFGNTPLAVEVTGTDEDGNPKYKLYYREGKNRRWEEISTWSGSASGGRANGNNILAAIAMVFETQYKDNAPYTEYKGRKDFRFDLKDPTKSKHVTPRFFN